MTGIGWIVEQAGGDGGEVGAGTRYAGFEPGLAEDLESVVDERLAGEGSEGFVVPMRLDRPPARTNASAALVQQGEAGSTASLLQKADQRLDSELEVFEIELFVGGVDVVVGQAEAHHHAGQAEVAVKVADDRNRPAGADEDCVFAPDLVEGAGGGLDVGVVDRNEAGVAGVNQPHVDVDAGRGNLLNVAFVLREGLGWSHAGNQPHGNLGRRLGGDYGLGTGSDEAAGHAVNLERGPRPGALKNAKALFADQLPRSDFGDAIVLLVERQALPRGEFFRAGRNDCRRRSRE